METFNVAEYLSKFYPNLNSDNSTYNRVCNVYSRTYDNISKLSADKVYSKNEIATVFDREINSMTNFQTYRLAAIRIMDLLNFNPETISNFKSIAYEDICTTVDFERIYWGNLRSIINYIETAEDVCKHRSLAPKIVAELLWYGITVSDMKFIRIKDIDSDGLTVKVNDKIVAVDSGVIYDISAYINENNNTGYLFCSKNGGECNETTIKRRLLRLNDILQRSGKQFDCRAIWYSGLFSRVYDNEDSLSKYARNDIKEKYEGWMQTYRKG